MPRRDEPLFEHAASLRVGSVELRATDDEERLDGKLAQLLLANTTSAVALLDTSGRVLARSAGALERAGDVAVGRAIWERPDGQREQADVLRRAVAQAAAGEPVELPDCMLRPLVDSDSAVRLVLLEWRPPSEGELERANALRERDARLFADLSHELRTPVALILGPVEAMIDAPNVTDAQRRRLDVVRRNAATLLKHVHELFELSSLDAAPSELAYRTVDLARLVTHATSHFEALAAERDIACEVDVPATLRAEVDPDRLERVVLNLLSNALDLTPRGGAVKVSLRALGGARALLAVEDSGPGVRPELREAIFERYRRGEPGGRRLGGGGLGLTITKEVVERHGGTITITDAASGGALFRVELPTRAPEGTPVETEAPLRTESREETIAVLRGTLATLESVAPSRAAPATRDRPRALVVEDDDGMRRFITESLGDELEVETAQNGEEGLALALALHPDLVVTDVVMPRMSGDHMIYAMRAHPELEGMPILVLSGRTDVGLRTELLRRGAQDYLIKPFSAEELRARAGNLVTVKRTRDLLRANATYQQHDIEALARAVTTRSGELATAWESMRVARDAAEAASRAKSRFLQLCSHELRTPLTTILLQLEMLEGDGPLPEAHLARIRRLDGAARRLQWLVESLLEHARIESGRLPLEPRLFQVRQVVEDVAEELGPRVRPELTLTVEHGSASLRSDPAFVRLVVLNLVDNAIKFTPRGEVRVRIEQTAHGARVEVADTGPGIPLEARLRIFDAFEPLEDVRHKHTPGLGLGLTLVQRVVEALGGRLDLSSDVGKGSTFTVDLPNLAC